MICSIESSLMIKYSDGAQHATKINLLKKILAILTQALHTDHETRQSDFNGMPFQRILISMFNELTLPDPVLEPISWNILECFGYVDHIDLWNSFIDKPYSSSSLGASPDSSTIGSTSSGTAALSGNFYPTPQTWPGPGLCISNSCYATWSS